MDVLREVQALSSEEVEEYCNERIKFLEEYYQKYSGRSLGYNVESYPTFIYLNENDYSFVETHCFYGGYIPLKTKITFGFTWNGSGYQNAGQYYYLDDTSYINEFVKFVRDKEINNEYELFDCILDFLNHYFARNDFKTSNYVERGDMCKMILKNSRAYHDPVNEHSIKMFKDRGNALCTENSVLAQNILSFFNIESYIVIGLVDRDGKGGSDHAFNLITYVEEETGERLNSLIDFSFSIPRIDIDHNIICYEPYMINLDSLDETFAEEFLSGSSEIQGEMYSFLDLDNLSLYLKGNSMIKYYVVDNNPSKKREKTFKKMKGEIHGYNR